MLTKFKTDIAGWQQESKKKKKNHYFLIYCSLTALNDGKKMETFE